MAEKKMLKADFHTHTRHSMDPHIKYTWKELIDRYAELSYDLIAITNHDELFCKKEAFRYAKKKGILIIPSVEAMVEGKDVLVINVKPGEKLPKTFEDLKRFKRENTLIVAPHPFFIFHSLGKSLERNISLFDGVEYSHFYSVLLNMNKKAEKLAKKHKLPLVGTSDAHHLFQIGHTYTLVDSNKDIQSVIKAVKNRKCRLVTKKLSIKDFFRIFGHVVGSQSFYTIFLSGE